MNQLTINVCQALACDDLDDLKTTLHDVLNHGADIGFSGFTYYTDTQAFYQANKDDIKAVLRDDARSQGKDGIYSLVAGFNCLDLTPDEVADAMHGEGDDVVQVENALAWYALESVAWDSDCWDDSDWLELAEELGLEVAEDEGDDENIDESADD